MKKLWSFSVACFLFCHPPIHAAQPNGVIVGVNIGNEGYLSNEAQETKLKPMADSGAKTIRTVLTPNTTDFITLAPP
jgi:hypothetical protein